MRGKTRSHGDYHLCRRDILIFRSRHGLKRENGPILDTLLFCGFFKLPVNHTRAKTVNYIVLMMTLDKEKRPWENSIYFYKNQNRNNGNIYSFAVPQNGGIFT